MPHAPIYQRPVRQPDREFTVNVRTAEGRAQYTIAAQSPTEARREALSIYAAEHDTPASAWVEAR